MRNLKSDLGELDKSDEQRSQRDLKILIIEDVAADVELTLLALESAGLSLAYDISSTAM